MTSLEAARRYLARGFAVIPVPARQKAPVLESWPTLRLTEADLQHYFRNGCNIGVLNGEPSGNLIDVDLDAPQALDAADLFLPETALIFGRASKRRAHREYVVRGTVPATTQFRDPDGAMLVELRATGSQTIWPTSVHPSDEMVAFDSEDEPAFLDAKALVLAIRRLAACALLARRWPKEPGDRHAIALAIAGYLLRGGLEEQRVAQIVFCAARVAGDEEAEGRRVDVVSTSKRLADGKRATGGPTLAALMGPDVVAKLGEWLGLASREEGDWSSRSFWSSPPWPDAPAAEVFHGLVGDIVRVIEPHSEADPMALLVQGLVAFGSVIGRGPHFVAEGAAHYVNLFVALVGETAKARKGSAWSQVRRLFRLVDSAWADDRITSGLSSGEGLIWAVRDPVGNGDPGVADKRLLVVEEEFAGTLRVMGREGNTLSPILRQAWDSGALNTLVKNSPARASGAHISIIGHITRDELRRYLGRTEAGNGFANRFLWLLVRRSKALPEGGQLDEAMLAPLAERLTKAVAFAREVRDLRFDAEARQIWHAVYPALSEGTPGLLGAVIARAEAQVVRLGCIYALLDCSDRIRHEHLLAALGVWDYCEASVRQIFSDTLGDPVADELLRALRVEGAHGMTRTEIRDLFGRNRRQSEIGRALGVLLEHGLAKVAREQTGGRPAERWFATGTTETTETTEDQSGDWVSSSKSFRSYLELAKAAARSGDATTGTGAQEEPPPGPAQRVPGEDDEAADAQGEWENFR
jgi:hypothetical protein